MNKVAKAQLKPHFCAVNPHLGSEPKGGLWDTGQDFAGPGSQIFRIYLACETVADRARAQGFLSPEEAADLRATIDLLDAEKVELEAKVDSLETIIDGIDTMESAGFRARRKPGKPKVPVSA